MLTFHPLLTNHAVLQHGQPLRLSGWADPGQQVRVVLESRQFHSVCLATVSPLGRWHAVIDPRDTGGLVLEGSSANAADPLPPGTTMTLHVEAGAEHVDLVDLVMGDVWFCSGQSNMEMPLRDALDGEAHAAGAEDAFLRLFTVPRRSTLTSQGRFGESAWLRSSPSVALQFSAVGYHFGSHLRRATSRPIGLIQSAVGATPVETWVRLGLLKSNPDWWPILDRAKESLEAFPDPEKRYADRFAAWDHDTDLAEREGRPLPGAQPKLLCPGHAWTPAGLWNAMVAPATDFPIRGVIWAQGASHPERAFQYRALFRALIRDWRAAWGDDAAGAGVRDLPFLFVQEAAFGPRRAEPGEHSWAELREAQAMALAEPRTAMAVSLDIGETANIHPVRKQPVGDRLALAARAMAYGHDTPSSSPVVASVRVEGETIRLRFDHAEGGLKTSDGGPVRGLAVSAGAGPGAGDTSRGNRGFVWAEARIEGSELVVWSPAVPKPAAVRYAWAQNPEANLVGATGLPVGPFRTDDWRGITVDVK